MRNNRFGYLYKMDMLERWRHDQERRRKREHLTRSFIRDVVCMAIGMYIFAFIWGAL